MKILLCTGMVICFLFSSISSFAQIQQVKFNSINETIGVSVGKINGITRDKYGFMWFADQSNGCIIRFDGSHMTRYRNDPKNPTSLGGSNLECIAVDSSGNIWIGFYGTGLDKFDPVTGIFTHFRHDTINKASLSDDFVSAVLVDHLGNVWVGNNGGLDLLDQKSGAFKHYSHKENDSTSLSNNTVRSIYEDRAGELWLGTGGFFEENEAGGGLNHFHRQSGNFTRYLSDPANQQSLIDNRVKAIFEDSHGTFWIGTSGDGLHTMDRKTGLFTRLRYNPKHPEQLSRPPVQNELDHIAFITEDADKKIWIGTFANGLTRYDPLSGQITRYGNKDDTAKAFNENSSWCAYATPDGIIWLCTENSNKSLYKIDIYNTIIPHFGNSEADGVFAFYEESAAVCWYGTNSGLVRKDFKNGTIRRFINNPREPNSISHNRVLDILKDKQGDFWIGTENGLNHFNLKTEKFTRYYNVPDKNTLYAVWSLCENSDSTIWVGRVALGGVDLFNKKTGKFVSYKHDPADLNTISNNQISHIYQEGANDLWVGTFNAGGLNKLNMRTGKFTRYLPGLSIGKIYRDAGGTLWVGASAGLFRYDKKSDSFDVLGDENSENYITGVAGIAADKEDNLWVSTEKGIYMVTKKRDQVFLYGKEYVVPGANFNFYAPSSFNRQDGELNFGTTNGYYAFYPEKLKAGFGKTPFYFTSFWLGNKEIKPGTGGPLKESLFNTKEIRLNHDQNVFSISTTFIDFRSVSGKKIYYQLENYDNEWRTAGAEDKLQYYKVPPGEYIFRIKTTNGSTGEWLEKSMAIIISPPWWKTWWAWCIYGLLLAALAFAVHRYQKSRVIKKERERTRTRELEQAKEIEKAYNKLKSTQAQLIQSEKMASLGELTAGIAHEIQNPLNFVNNFSDLNKDLIKELEEARSESRANSGRDPSNEADILNILKENSEKISLHGKRAENIVKGMLQHSRKSTGIKEPTDINALADEYMRLSYHGLRAKDKTFNADMNMDLDPTLPLINVIPQDIGRVLLNLFNNAFWACAERGKTEKWNNGEMKDGLRNDVLSPVSGLPFSPLVIVSTKNLGDKVEIKVVDNGPGIPDNIKDKIFQPFFTTKPTGQGTGLGLSLAYDIIKAHGGELKVGTKEGEARPPARAGSDGDDPVGRGSEFIIQLPIA